MKRILVILFLISIGLMFSVKEEGKVIIPTSAIRYRIIASSNDFHHQEEKLMIHSEIEPIINTVLMNSSTIDESRENIKEAIPKIENIISKYNTPYDINYGMNYFPEKVYKDVTYKEGNYESLVITLGDGLGDNWWCVLFPPLCLLEAKETEFEDATYSLYIKTVLDKFHS